MEKRQHELVERLHDFTPSTQKLPDWAATVAVWTGSTTDAAVQVGWKGKARVLMRAESILSTSEATNLNKTARATDHPAQILDEDEFLSVDRHLIHLGGARARPSPKQAAVWPGMRSSSRAQVLQNTVTGQRIVTMYNGLIFYCQARSNFFINKY